MILRMDHERVHSLTATPYNMTGFRDAPTRLDGLTAYLSAGAGTNPSYNNPKTNTTGERKALLQCQLPNGTWPLYQR